MRPYTKWSTGKLQPNTYVCNLTLRRISYVEQLMLKKRKKKPCTRFKSAFYWVQSPQVLLKTSSLASCLSCLVWIYQLKSILITIPMATKAKGN